jgi:hypothetical protein
MAASGAWGRQSRSLSLLALRSAMAASGGGGGGCSRADADAPESVAATGVARCCASCMHLLCCCRLAASGC